MPFSASDATRHKKDLGPGSRRKWADIANSILQNTGDEGLAIKTANARTKASIARRMRKKAQGLPAPKQ